MPIATEILESVDQTINRLAAETVLAQVGHDEGMIPAYSLLGELRDYFSLEAALREPVTSVQQAIEDRLDHALPFDEASLAAVRELVEWLPEAHAANQNSQAVPAWAGCSKADPAPAEVTAAVDESPEPEVEADILLSIDLGESGELLSEFHAEAVDHLAQIEAALLALEHNPSDGESINSIFRSFHTIKGNAGFLGLTPMNRLAHEVESLLDLARNQKLLLNSTIISEILRSRDALVALTEQVAIALEQGKLPDQVVPISHLITAVKTLAKNGGEAPAGSAQAPVVPNAVAKSADMLSNTSTTTATPRASTQTVRVNTEKLDSLMDVVGELVIVQSQLIESSRGIGDGGSPLQRNVGQLSRITKDLQGTAMALRMIPVKPIFQKMERLSRDLARDFGKKISFSTSGEETELDRTVVEEIGDPLVHMVRNALDHGLEAPEERLACGKPESGSVMLKAYHRGGNIVIELTDDGRGLDPEKLLTKARRKGLIAEDAQLTREEIYNLIFMPGFSTAAEVTSVSGRGVGMDVVKRNILKLRGKVEIESELGKGSTFRIKLPLTMAIIDGLVVRVGADRFILPTTSVQVALKPEKESISMVQGKGEVINLRGRILPLHRLDRCFNIPGEADHPWDGIVVILEVSGKTSALLVDEMVSKQEVVIKNLGALMQGLPGVSGGAILGDGSIALILDPGSLRHAA